MNSSGKKWEMMKSLNIPVYQIAGNKKRNYLFFHDILFELMRLIYEKHSRNIDKAMPD